MSDHPVYGMWGCWMHPVAGSELTNSALRLLINVPSGDSQQGVTGASVRTVSETTVSFWGCWKGLGIIKNYNTGILKWDAGFKHRMWGVHFPVSHVKQAKNAQCT